MVYCERKGINCFLVLREAIPERVRAHYFNMPLPFVPLPSYGPRGVGHTADPRNRKPLKIYDDLINFFISSIDIIKSSQITR